METREPFLGSRASVVALLAAGLATVLLAMVLAADPKSAEAAFPGTNGKIAFISDRSGNFEIWRMEPNGTSPRNLTSSSLRENLRPAYSPDGTKIAFSSNRDGDHEIFVMNGQRL